MKIKVVKNNGRLEFNDIIIRSLLINGILFKMIQLIMVCVLNKELYISGILYVEAVQMLFVLVSGFMILYRSDKRGLQDMICKTSVIKE